MIRGIDVFTGETIELELLGGRIANRKAVPPDSPSSEKLPYISPGWVDLQVNGWRGLDWNGDNVSVQDAEELCRLLARRGTTRFLPTVITAARETMLDRIRRIRALCDQSDIVRRAVAGIHVEGPFIASEDGPRGAHDRNSTRDSSIEEFQSWMDVSDGLVRLVTLAPERKGAVGLIGAMADAGVVPAIGHTGASAAQIRAAVDAGARFSTHLGNGLANEVHRHHNPIWTQLAEDRLSAGVIADGHHLPLEVLRTLVRAKEARRVVTVSDAAAPGGNPAGTYKWSGIEVEVSEEGRLGLAGTPYLAGAGHLQDRAVATLVRAVGLTVADAITTVTRNPLELIGEDGASADLQPGCPADIVVFTLEDDMREAAIHEVYLGGELQ